jgi:hypothetical protein
MREAQFLIDDPEAIRNPIDVLAFPPDIPLEEALLARWFLNGA